MDKLEDFIRNNRSDLDIYEPDPDVWDRIRKVNRSGRSQLLKWVAAAAIVVVVMGTSIILYKGARNSNTDYISDKFGQQELNETEIFYNTIVNSLYREAEPFFTSQPDIKQELYTDMARIDSLCNEIKKDLKDNIANQEVIEALVQNYRIKIQILEEMLSTLREDFDMDVNENKDEI